MKRQTRPLVITGPSGAGKGTLIEMLKTDFPQRVGFVVSHTTRQPRSKGGQSTGGGAEVNGIDYHFVSKEEFLALRADDGFVESAEVHGNFYGTSLGALQQVQNEGKMPILDIDTQVADKVKKYAANKPAFNPRYLFIMPPSIEELEARLRGRASDAEDKIQKRLRNARGEMEIGNRDNYWDKRIVNDQLPRAYNELKVWVEGWAGPAKPAAAKEK